MGCCRNGNMADSFLRMVTGWAMRYSNSSPSSWPVALATIELGCSFIVVAFPTATSLCPGGGAGDAILAIGAATLPFTNISPPATPPTISFVSRNPPSCTTGRAALSSASSADGRFTYLGA